MGRAIKLVLYYFAYQLAFTFLVGLPAGIIKVMNEISENDNLAYAAGKNTASMTGLVMVLAGIAMIWHLIYFKYVQFNKTSWTEVPAKTILLSIPFIIAAMFICNVASEFIELPNLVEDTFIGMSRNVFGIIAIARAVPCAKEKEAIFATAKEYLGPALLAAKSFKVESKRSDKSFPMGSIQLSQWVGGALHDAFPHLTVDVHTPELTVYLEVREDAAYVHGPSVPGAGGLPTGTGGRAAVLLSGGIDSPVAGYMIAKRGVEIECIHFFSYPYTSELAKEKVLELAHIMTKFCGRMTVDIVGFTEIQEAIRDHCREEYFTIIMRRFMMRIAEAIGRDHGAKCLVTGENLGQVASQTMDAMAVTGAVVHMPIFHPLIGMDKEEIVTVARRIGTLDTSILPYEDCCTVFTPKHPKTKPVLAQVEAEEQKLDVEGLIARAIANTEKTQIRYYEDEHKG